MVFVMVLAMAVVMAMIVVIMPAIRMRLVRRGNDDACRSAHRTADDGSVATAHG